MVSERTEKAKVDLIAGFKRGEIYLIIDETGDKKEGKKRQIMCQYLGSWER